MGRAVAFIDSMATDNKEVNRNDSPERPWDEEIRYPEAKLALVMISLSGYRSKASRRVRGGSEALRSTSFDLFTRISGRKKKYLTKSLCFSRICPCSKLFILAGILFKDKILPLAHVISRFEPQATPSPLSTTSSPSMKRKPSEQEGTPSKRAPRQDPVSCELCRRKKLKCNRQQPCSSCVTRQLPCSYGASVSSSNISHDQPADSTRDTKAISDESRVPTANIVVARSDGQISRDRNESVMTADWLEKIVLGDRVPTGMRATRRGLNEPSKADVKSPGQAVAGNPLSISWTASSENPATVQLPSFLPKKAEAMTLFQYYNKYIDYLYHIILPDRVKEQIDAIYQAIKDQEQLNLNHLALLFSIIASSLFLQLSIESSVHAEACSREYIFLTGAALMQSNYSAYPTIEGLQAMLIVAHNLSNTNCHPSVRAVFVHGAIVSQAKSLMLHCIDSPQFEKKADADMMEVELKRRLWWDLASYDW